MFGKKKGLNFKNNNYKMKEKYQVSDLVVANLEYVTAEEMPVSHETEQKYLFEKILEDGKIRYREVFTGLIVDSFSQYFNLPKVINVVSLNEEIKTSVNNISKYALLFVLNEVNAKENSKKLSKK